MYFVKWRKVEPRIKSKIKLRAQLVTQITITVFANHSRKLFGASTQFLKLKQTDYLNKPRIDECPLRNLKKILFLIPLTLCFAFLVQKIISKFIYFI